MKAACPGRSARGVLAQAAAPTCCASASRLAANRPRATWARSSAAVDACKPLVWAIKCSATVKRPACTRSATSRSSTGSRGTAGSAASESTGAWSVGSAGARQASRLERRGGRLARQPAKQQRVDRTGVRLIGVAIEPRCQFIDGRMMEAAEIAVGQDRADQQLAVQLGGFAQSGGDPAMRLVGEDAAYARGIAGGQWLWQRHTRRAAGHFDARNCHCCLLARPRLLRPCSGERGGCQDRRPGDQRPGGRKAGERVTDPSHPLRLAAGVGSGNP